MKTLRLHVGNTSKRFEKLGEQLKNTENVTMNEVVTTMLNVRTSQKCELMKHSVTNEEILG